MKFYLNNHKKYNMLKVYYIDTIGNIYLGHEKHG